MSERAGRSTVTDDGRRTCRECSEWVPAELRPSRVGQDADGWCLVGREPMDGSGHICVFWGDVKRADREATR